MELRAQDLFYSAFIKCSHAVCVVDCVHLVRIYFFTLHLAIHQALISISLSSLYDKLPDSSPLDVFITSPAATRNYIRHSKHKSKKQHTTYSVLHNKNKN